MGKKPNFGKGLKRKTNVSTVLQAGSASSNLALVPDDTPEPETPTEAKVEEPKSEPPSPKVESSPPLPTNKSRKQLDSRKKKLSHMKTLFEYHEKREINGFLAELGDRVGHNINFSVFTRGLLLAAMANKEDFLNVAEKMAGLERPSNGDVEAYRQYEAQIGQMIFDAFRLRGNAPRRG